MSKRDIIDRSLWGLAALALGFILLLSAVLTLAARQPQDGAADTCRGHLHFRISRMKPRAKAARPHNDRSMMSRLDMPLASPELGRARLMNYGCDARFIGTVADWDWDWDWD